MHEQADCGLAISEKTVNARRGRVMAKTGVRSVAGLVKLCGEPGIAQQPVLRKPRSPDGFG